jgi:hypothetical protein
MGGRWRWWWWWWWQDIAKHGVLLVCAIYKWARHADGTFRECERCYQFVCSRASEQVVEALPRHDKVKVLQRNKWAAGASNRRRIG